MTSFDRMIANKARGPLYSSGQRVASRFDAKLTATVTDAQWLAICGDVFPCWTYLVAWDHDSDRSGNRYREGYLASIA